MDRARGLNGWTAPAVPVGAAPASGLSAPPVVEAGQSFLVAGSGQGGLRVRGTSDQRLALVVGDVLALIASFAVGLGLLSLGEAHHSSIHHFGENLLFVPMFIVAMAAQGMYGRGRRMLPSLVSDAADTARALAMGVLFSLALDAMLGGWQGRDLHVTQAVAMALPALVTVPLARAIVIRLRLDGRSYASRVIIAGSGRVASSIEARLLRCDDVRVVGMVDDDPPVGHSVLGGLADLERLCLEQRIDHVLVAFSKTPSHEVVSLLREVEKVTRISIVPRLYELLSWRSGVEELHGIPLLHVAPPQLSTFARATKRAFDLVVSGVAIVLLAPVWLLAAVAIRATSPGPAIFRQARTGRGGEPFSIFKFRTMEEGAEAQRDELSDRNEVDGPIFKIKADPRVTRVGAFLRRTSLDELPQLLNVFAGHMSLVGPRPFPLEESRQIEGILARRFDVPPGMTGLWQISGRSDLSFDDLCHLDNVYVGSWSLWWDMRIILQTPASVLRRTGAC